MLRTQTRIMSCSGVERLQDAGGTQMEGSMLSAAISSVSSDHSGAVRDHLEQYHLLPSHLARAQEAYNRVSEHLTNIKSSRVKASKGSPPSPTPAASTDLAQGTMRQLDEAMEDLRSGLLVMQESRAPHLALRSQIAAELQSSELALWDADVVPSILAASGICTPGRRSDPAEVEMPSQAGA